MGYIHLGVLPNSRKWKDVVALLTEGAPAADVVAASAAAAERELLAAANDPVFVEAVRLLAAIPAAARAEDFGLALREAEISATGVLDLLTLVAAAGNRLDAVARTRSSPSDIGETSLLKMFRADRLEDGAAVGATATASQATKYDGPFVNVAQFRPDQPEVAFYEDMKTKVVEIAGLGAVRGATATVPHALKPAFEEDRDAGLDASEFRYTPLRELARADEVSKGAVHQRVSRCRREFRDFYSALSDEPLPDGFLIQIKERDGYRLDPQIRIIGRPQLGEREIAAGTERPAKATSAESDVRSAPRA